MPSHFVLFRFLIGRSSLVCVCCLSPIEDVAELASQDEDDEVSPTRVRCYQGETGVVAFLL